jgi:hypothetical protein
MAQRLAINILDPVSKAFFVFKQNEEKSKRLFHAVG